MGYQTGDSEIYLVNPDGTGLVRITDTPALDASPAWSPDGRQLLFVRDGGFMVMNADGSDVRSLGVGGRNPTWSPDGNRIAFDGFGGNIWVMNADGSDLRKVTDSTEPAWSYGPTWSPDSRRIAFAHAPNDDWPFQIYVINADGTGMMHLGPDLPGQGLVSASYSPAWSPR
jgi:TolB protein